MAGAVFAMVSRYDQAITGWLGAGVGIAPPTVSLAIRNIRAGDRILLRSLQGELLIAELLEKAVDRGFGDPDRPLLVSCRSGAKFSMPGMMDTVLNLGLNDEVVEGIDERLTH